MLLRSLPGFPHTTLWHISVRCARARFRHPLRRLHDAPDANADMLSRLSAGDTVRLAARLSPLAVRACVRNDELRGSGSSLSTAQAGELQRAAPIAAAVSQARVLRAELSDAVDIARDAGGDPELSALAADEMGLLHEALAEHSRGLVHLLLADHQRVNNDNVDAEAGRQEDNAALVEIRAGTGGDEASIFAADVLAMYHATCSTADWRAHEVSRSDSTVRGVRQALLKVSGPGCVTTLAGEAGVHRVQRVPRTEGAGRIHTSTVSVVVLPWTAPPGGAPEVRMADVRVDVYRASGAGGQHVNTTESAVRVTHVPTGIVATCQDERSQHRNRSVALANLAAKLAARRVQQAADRTLAQRRSQLGAGTGGERSDRVRTYNFQQRRVTDHRIVLRADVIALFEKDSPVLQLDKNFELNGVLNGGRQLIHLMQAVRDVAILNDLADMARTADTLACDESDRLVQDLLGGDYPRKVCAPTP